MRACLVLALLFAVLRAGNTPPAAQERQSELAPYLLALEARSVGDIDARAQGLPTRPDGPEIPYDGVSVVAFPYAAALEARLDAIKRQQRDSMARYTETHADLTAAIAAHEAHLLSAGAGQLIRRAVSNAEGALHVPGVPAGDWILLGWREQAHAVKSPRTPTRGAARFAGTPVTIGYAAVSYWRIRVTVRPGETAEVKLSDRSVWLTAVREERVLPGGTPAEPSKRP